MSITTIKFTTQFENLNDLIQAKASFEQKHPDVQIDIEQVTDNFESLRAFNSDAPPDIMDSGGWALCLKEGLFIDLMPCVREIDGLEEDLNAGILGVALQDDKLTGLPIDISVPLILINKAMFDRAGLPYPTDDWTWDEMIELGKKLTIRDDQGLATQFGFGTGVDIEYFEPFVMRNGGRYLSPDGRTARGYVDSPATIEAFKKVVDMFRVHHINRNPGEPSGAGELHQGFAMVFAFTWFTGGLIHHNIDDHFEVVGLPRMPGEEEANMIYMGGCGITTKSQHPDLAWAFLRHYILERPERFQQANVLPLTYSLAQQSGMTENKFWQRYLKELEVVQTSGFYLNERWNSSRQLINQDMERMILDGDDVGQLLRSWTRYA
ncbi:sugar ABC transporter substrate-binding protein [Paenibacillus baekrokdamisoli]|uniref:Sugar ABC transporter substrate-binding protein n=1 Tax=Paenibacillus baekrokdamisoli TaxID=1712516 RepID=A0A3G9IRY7_9BACL|nr:extracellular solute-binding protein [Paenibacillus baekrokdamisoli]MBB3071208.1 multiple sugar transport system substrate-binding protein [Paenibacillus baekrokdamisoli]BBH21627.1 sugar ABC transporter substrate-binding protein [Paenibacillus baekrokdamisoli]